MKTQPVNHQKEMDDAADRVLQWMEDNADRVLESVTKNLDAIRLTDRKDGRVILEALKGPSRNAEFRVERRQDRTLAVHGGEEYESLSHIFSEKMHRFQDRAMDHLMAQATNCLGALEISRAASSGRGYEMNSTIRIMVERQMDRTMSRAVHGNRVTNMPVYQLTDYHWKLLRERVMDQDVRQALATAGLAERPIAAWEHNMILPHAPALAGEKNGKFLKFIIEGIIPLMKDGQTLAVTPDLAGEVGRTMDLTPRESEFLPQATGDTQSTKDHKERLETIIRFCTMLGPTIATRDDHRITFWLRNLANRLHRVAQSGPEQASHATTILNEVITTLRETPTMMDKPRGAGRDWTPTPVWSANYKMA